MVRRLWGKGSLLDFVGGNVIISIIVENGFKTLKLESPAMPCGASVRTNKEVSASHVDFRVLHSIQDTDKLRKVCACTHGINL